MTKYSALFAAVAVAFAGVAYAAAPAAPIVLPAKPGNITFKHDVHKAVKCETCHAGKPEGSKLGLTKDTGHALCLECHKKEGGKAPQKCAECHKKA
ncbi:MAG: cytochrome c3 family protein [Anaeromyxobacter sp.]